MSSTNDFDIDTFGVQGWCGADHEKLFAEFLYAKGLHLYSGRILTVMHKIVTLDRSDIPPSHFHELGISDALYSDPVLDRFLSLLAGIIDRVMVKKMDDSAIRKTHFDEVLFMSCPFKYMIPVACVDMIIGKMTPCGAPINYSIIPKPTFRTAHRASLHECSSMDSSGWIKVMNFI
jgi:hypothetical protein